MMNTDPERIQNGAGERVLAMDVGGTFIKSGILHNGILSELPQVPSCSDRSAAEIIGALQKAIHAAGTVDRIAIAIPGPFDYHRGVSMMTHKFGAINNVDLTAALDPGVPLRFMHDANAFLAGELYYGSLRGIKRAGGVTLGTGLGAAVSIDNKLINCPLGSPADEVSLWNRSYRGGTAEDFVSSRALLKKYPAPSVYDIAQHAHKGDEKALRVWYEFGEDLANLLTDWITNFHLEKIVLGGQISRDLKLFSEPLKDLPVTVSTLSGAALYGVAAFPA